MVWTPPNRSASQRRPSAAGCADSATLVSAGRGRAARRAGRPRRGSTSTSKPREDRSASNSRTSVRSRSSPASARPIAASTVTSGFAPPIDVEHGDVERAATHVEDQHPPLWSVAVGQVTVRQPGHPGGDRLVDQGRVVDRQSGLAGQVDAGGAAAGRSTSPGSPAVPTAPRPGAGPAPGSASAISLSRPEHDLVHRRPRARRRSVATRIWSPVLGDAPLDRPDDAVGCADPRPARPSTIRPSRSAATDGRYRVRRSKPSGRISARAAPSRSATRDVDVPKSTPMARVSIIDPSLPSRGSRAPC